LGTELRLTKLEFALTLKLELPGGAEEGGANVGGENEGLIGFALIAGVDALLGVPVVIETVGTALEGETPPGEYDVAQPSPDDP
jgi:hypothetical protein